MKETPYELLKDTEKKQLGKNKEAKMTIYNALPHKSTSVSLCAKPPRKFGIHSSSLTKAIHKLRIARLIFSLKNCRTKVTAIKEAKDLATLPLDELIGNLKVYEMVLDNDGVDFKTAKENVKSLALKTKVTREQTSDNSTCQDESNEDEEINLMAKNFKKFSQKSVKVHDKFDICQVKGKGCEISRRKRECYNCGSKNHLASKCPKPNNKSFIGVTWSDSEEDDEPLTCQMAIDSQEVQPNPCISNIINLQKENEELLKFSKDLLKTYEKLLQEKHILEKERSKLSSKVKELELEVKKLANNKEVIEPCKKCIELTQEVDSLKSNVSKLQNETLNFSKFKKSSIALDDMLSHQKFSQDKEEPKNIKKAIKDKSWTMAMQEELDEFICNDVWDLVPCPEARLVAQGYNQQEGIDYDETYALVATLESIKILLAYTCCYMFKLFQMDVKSVFLKEVIDEEVYVAQPPGFIDFQKPNHVYKLKKALYELKQAPKAWMLLDIISKMNRKLEDEKIKRNDKGNGKVNEL
ncbi:retrovirus-related pol polyprotein from transposon TNT 1-94 [Tanacetum coccineum]